MSLVKVTGTNLVRDTKSMALINTDTNEKNEYYNKLRLIKNQKDEINKVKLEISEVRDDLKELKSMVAQLLSKGLNV